MLYGLYDFGGHCLKQRVHCGRDITSREDKKSGHQYTRTTKQDDKQPTLLCRIQPTYGRDIFKLYRDIKIKFTAFECSISSHSDISVYCLKRDKGFLVRF